ncbi:hypothetical protein AB4402_11520 [Vibrio breoganii]|uniref:hypothetical protein n=1 Tax=Vibrio breoganii TaxID=553239 RepID=UPI000C865102|nr:hypothetical protein [Vibrio breoganii]PMM18588.1 hypothetical protein BCT59_11310 [Vibrio breoganii]PMO76332.1 hypothetical protein BCT02_10605 [Vibrio breoganii]PMO89051.1 hypothetical protein BCS99_06165 [Vibrio breoganii]
MALTGLHKEFYDIERRIAPHAVDADSQSLVIRYGVIEEVLRPYANVGVIYRLEGGFKRIGSLMEAIVLDSYISVNR